VHPVEHHAWVEQRGVVIDTSVDMVAGKTDLERRGIFYVAEVSYEPEEALVQALRTRHWGPWETVQRNAAGMKRIKVPAVWARDAIEMRQAFDGELVVVSRGSNAWTIDVSQAALKTLLGDAEFYADPDAKDLRESVPDVCRSAVRALKVLREARGLSRNLDVAANKLPRVTQHFGRCLRVIHQKFQDFGGLELEHDERAGGDNGAGAERQFAYCAEGEPIIIAFAAKAEKLPDRNLAGLMTHEFGHALEHRYGVRELEKRLGKKLPKGVEHRADVIAETVFGEKIRYDDHDVQCVSCDGTAPRPGHLAKNGPEGLRFVPDVRGAHSDQVDMSIYAIRNEKYVGRIDFSEFRGRVHIQWIEVIQEERKAGIARELVKEMLKQFDADGIEYADVDWGMTTPDGTTLKAAMDRELGR